MSSRGSISNEQTTESSHKHHALLVSDAMVKRYIFINMIKMQLFPT